MGEVSIGTIAAGTAAVGLAAVDTYLYFSKGGEKNIPPGWLTDHPKEGESADDFARRVCAARYGNVGGCGRGPGSEFSKIRKWAQDWIDKHG